MKLKVHELQKNKLFSVSKKYLLLLLVAVLWSCAPEADQPQPVAAAQYLNVAYGDDPEQTYDVYLPAQRSAATKIVFLVHGGGWISGSKEDMIYLVQFMKLQFPQYAIVNLNYRLATTTSPAYPKQINDVAAAVAHAGSHYGLSKDYGFIGTSAGGHLSMLYAYKMDPAQRVKMVCNVVGPSDFNDPSYLGTPVQSEYLPYIGSELTPAYLSEISPITYVNAQSAPTIQFMGNTDPLVPATQGQRLEDKLDSFGVANEFNIYQASHGDFNVADSQDIFGRLSTFLTAHL